MEVEDEGNFKGVNLEEMSKGLKSFANVWIDISDCLAKYSEEVRKRLPKMSTAKSEVYRRTLRNRASSTTGISSKKSTNAGETVGTNEGKLSGGKDAEGVKGAGNLNSGPIKKGNLHSAGNPGSGKPGGHQLTVLLKLEDKKDTTSSKADFLLKVIDDLKYDEECQPIKQKLMEFNENAKKEKALKPKKKTALAGKTPPTDGKEKKLREKTRGTNKEDNDEGDGEIILSYFKPAFDGKKDFRAQLLRHDLKTLEDEEFVNDAIIFFFLKFIQSELLPDEMHKKVYIFDTFFIHKFREKCTPDLTEEKCTKAYHELKSWTKSVDILSKDYLIFPIHENDHWSLIVVCHPTKWFETDGGNASGDGRKMEIEDDWQKPCIIGFDSLEVLQKTYPEMIRTYLYLECKNRHPERFAKLPEKYNSGARAPFYQMMVTRSITF